MALSDSEKYELCDYQIDKARERARKDLLAFTLYTMPEYRVNWHHRRICNELNTFARGGTRFLMIFMPPRHGKSELVSRRFPAFLHGLYPNSEIFAASYLDSLAGDMTKDVQAVIDTPEYRDLFPGTRIPSAGGSYVLGTRNMTEHSIVGQPKGKYRGQGVGGSFTGKGANFICFPKGVGISTSSGYKDISQIQEGEYVWAYDHKNEALCLRRVETVYKNKVAALVRVQTSGGREVLCTPDHPFYSSTERTYREAKDLAGHGVIVQSRVHETQADGCRSILYFLQTAVRKTALRIREELKKGVERSLLLQSMFTPTPQFQEPPPMPDLQKAHSPKDSSILQLGVRPTEALGASTVFPLFARLFRNAISCETTRWISMCGLFQKEESYRASHQRKESRQPAREPGYCLPKVPHVSPPPLGLDSVSTVTAVSSGEVEVYDLRVEGSHNFFANGILVHNCIDDPIKGREIADSEVFRERLWQFWKNDLISRLETNLESGRPGQVLITLTRWHEDDLAGRLLEEMRLNPEAIQWKVVSYPAIRVNSDDETDPRQVGESLWPEKYSVDELTKFKVDARAWSSLYQQNPVPLGGALFKEDMFRFGQMPSAFDYTFIMADTAYDEKKENDFTVFTAFGVKSGELFVSDVWRAQIKAADVEGPAINFIKRNQKYGFRGAYIEPKGHGIYLNQMLPRKQCMLPGETQLKEFFKDRRTDKVERANNAIPWLVGRFVTINEAIPFKEDLMSEVLGFPRSKHDDFVDTLVDGVKFVFGRALSILDACR